MVYRVQSDGIDSDFTLGMTRERAEEFAAVYARHKDTHTPSEIKDWFNQDLADQATREIMGQAVLPVGQQNIPLSFTMQQESPNPAQDVQMAEPKPQYTEEAQAMIDERMQQLAEMEGDGEGQTAVPYAPLKVSGKTTEQFAIDTIDAEQGGATYLYNSHMAKMAEQERATEDWSDLPGISFAKGVVRWTTAGLTAPGQQLVANVQEAQGRMLDASDQEWSDWESRAESNDLGAMWLNFGSQGDGWFGAGGAAGEARERAMAKRWYDKAHYYDTRKLEKQADGTLAYTEGEKIPVNVGNSAAEGWGLTPGTSAYTFVSAAAGIGYEVILDPLNLLPVGWATKGYKAAKAGATLGRAAEGRAMKAAAEELTTRVDDLKVQKQGIDAERVNLQAQIEEARKLGDNTDELDAKLADLSNESAARGVLVDRFQRQLDTETWVSQEAAARGLDTSSRADEWEQLMVDAVERRTQNAEAAGEEIEALAAVHRAAMEAGTDLGGLDELFEMARAFDANGAGNSLRESARLANKAETAQTSNLNQAAMQNTLVRLEQKAGAGLRTAGDEFDDAVDQLEHIATAARELGDVETLAQAEQYLTVLRNRFATVQQAATKSAADPLSGSLARAQGDIANMRRGIGDLNAENGFFAQQRAYLKNYKKPGVTESALTRRLREARIESEISANPSVQKMKEGTPVAPANMQPTKRAKDLDKLEEDLAKNKGIYQTEETHQLGETPPIKVEGQGFAPEALELSRKLDTVEQNAKIAMTRGSELEKAAAAKQLEEVREVRTALEKGLDTNANGAQTALDETRQYLNTRVGEDLKASPFTAGPASHTLNRSLDTVDDNIRRVQENLITAQDDYLANRGLFYDRALEIATRFGADEGLRKALEGGDMAIEEVLNRVLGLTDRTVNQEQLIHGLFGPGGEHTVKYLVKEDSGTAIQLRAGNRMSREMADRLARATTPEEVKDIITDGVGRDWTGSYNTIGMKAAKASNVAAESEARWTARMWSKMAERSYKLSEKTKRKVPWSHHVDLTNADSLSRGLYDYLTYTGIKQDEAIKLVDEVMAVPGTVRARRKAVADILGRKMMAIAGDSKYAIDEDSANALAERIGKALIRNEEDMEDFRKTLAAKMEKAAEKGEELSDVDKAALRHANQMSRSLYLPEPQEIRRVLKKGKNVSDETAGADANKTLNFIDTMFRVGVLINPRYLIRNFLEGQTRKWVQGDAEDPLSFLGRLLHRKAGQKAFKGDITDKRFAQDIEDLMNATPEERDFFVSVNRSHSGMDPNLRPRLEQTGEAVLAEDTLRYYYAWASNLEASRQSEIDNLIVAVHQADEGKIPPLVVQKMQEGMDAKGAIVYYYMHGDGKKWLDAQMASDPDFWEGTIKTNADGGYTQGSVTTWIEQNYEAVERLTRNFDPEVLHYRGQIGMRGPKMKGRGQAPQSFKKIARQMKKDGLHSGGPKVYTVSGTAKPRGWINRQVDRFFDAASTTEDITLWQPLARREYWSSVTDNFKFMSKADQKQVLDTAYRQLIAETPNRFSKQGKLYARMEKIYKSSDEGFLGADEVHAVGLKQGSAKAKETYYDAFERKQWAQATWIAMPFVQAWANSTAFLAKQVTNPQGYMKLRRVGQAQDGLEGFEHWTKEEWAQNAHQIMGTRRAPVMITDPFTGDVSMQIPFLGELAGALTGGDTDMVSAYTSIDSMTPMFGVNPINPTPSPILTMPYRMAATTLDIDRKIERLGLKPLEELVMPIVGEYEGAAEDIFSIVTPSILQKLRTVIDPAEKEATRLALMPKVTTYLMTRYPEKYTSELGNVTDKALLQQDAEALADRWAITEGLLSTIWPGSLRESWNMYVEGDKVKNQALLRTEFYLNTAKFNGNYDKALVEFEKEYGPWSFSVLMSGKEGGNIPKTPETNQFALDHPELLEQYDDVYGMFFDYHPEYSPGMAKWLKRQGYTDYKDFNEMVDSHDSRLYFFYKGWIEEKRRTGEMTEADYGALKKDMESQYGLYQPDTDKPTWSKQYDRTKEAVFNTALGETMGGKAAKEWITVRDGIMRDLGIREWTDTEEGRAAKKALEDRGLLLAETSPAFARFWNSLFKKEFN